jgi:hypothetical protein
VLGDVPTVNLAAQHDVCDQGVGDPLVAAGHSLFACCGLDYLKACILQRVNRCCPHKGIVLNDQDFHHPLP